MPTQIHLSADIEWLIEQQKYLDYPLIKGVKTPKEVEILLKSKLALGYKVLPFSDCPGFDYQTGCPGHPYEEASADDA